ncbi:arginine--tRNA ligase [Candidatus Babeliales bacterium]|nr:arginine--tRNA ligase [Candidatus Babeliales bacterium]
MNIIKTLKKEIIAAIQKSFSLSPAQSASLEVTLNVDKDATFGDMSCNAAMVLARALQQNPRQLAQRLQQELQEVKQGLLAEYLESITIAGPGFLNFAFKQKMWELVAAQLLAAPTEFFKLEGEPLKKYLIEYVSANPTGPPHLGTGRGGIIGDVLANALSFLGHTVHREYYINDAGNQIKLLGQTLQVRCKQQLGMPEDLPEGAYQGEYINDIAQECLQEFGEDVVLKDDEFFEEYAKNHLLQIIKEDLLLYGIKFDEWFSEKKLHDNGSVDAALKKLKKAGLAYEQDGALWFKSTEFGDEKDRVVKKSTGEMTYIAGDVAYHQNKFERGYDHLINIFGQDHHGYVMRLKATMQALGYPADKLDVILYQLVSIKKGEEAVKMSKRSGSFTTLRDVVDAVGTDVARFFYLNRKAEAHLELDLSIALKKSNENPVFYIQYAYVRIMSVLEKAALEPAFASFAQQLKNCSLGQESACKADALHHVFAHAGPAENELLKKIVSLQDILKTIEQSYQTHLLAYYSWELANKFHNFYTNNRIIDTDNPEVTNMRLFLAVLVRNTLHTCLTLLGVSRPEKM